MLKIKEIEKIYSNGRGLNSLSLDIECGEIVCLIGPNGSGKSTALNIVSGILKSNSGHCFLQGQDTSEIGAKKNIGFLEENPFYYEHISVVVFLNFIWGVKYRGESNDDIYRLLQSFDMINYKDTKIKDLSQGLKKRVGIISALMNCPNLIILDEPTNGLDTQSVIKLKEEILLAQQKKCIIVISSHILDFLKDIGTRVIFLKDGQNVKDIKVEPYLNLDNVYKAIYM